MNIVTDVMIMAIPAPVLINIQTTLWKKIGLLALFGGGVFVMVAAILRVTMVMMVSYPTYTSLNTQRHQFEPRFQVVSFRNNAQLKNGPTAAIWSCREDFVAIAIGQAILIRPLFFKSFWTQKPTRNGRYTQGTSKTGSKPGVSFEMNTKRSHKNKQNDPFSVTAALATVDDYGGSQDNIINPYAGQEDLGNLTREHSRPFSGDLESGMAARHEKLVIHVSKLLKIENTEDNTTLQRMDQLRATNQARAWR